MLAYALVLLGAQTAVNVPAPPPLPVRKAIMAAIGDKLLDGESARYRWPDMPVDHTITYCGFVNAKNSYGAYTGFKLFHVAILRSTKNPALVSLELVKIRTDGDDAMNGFIDQQCAGAGFDLNTLPPTRP